MFTRLDSQEHNAILELPLKDGDHLYNQQSLRQRFHNRPLVNPLILPPFVSPPSEWRSIQQMTIHSCRGRLDTIHRHPQSDYNDSGIGHHFGRSYTLVIYPSKNRSGRICTRRLVPPLIYHVRLCMDSQRRDQTDRHNQKCAPIAILHRQLSTVHKSLFVTDRRVHNSPSLEIRHLFP